MQLIGENLGMLESVSKNREVEEMSLETDISGTDQNEDFLPAAQPFLGRIRSRGNILVCLICVTLRKLKLST